MASLIQRYFTDRLLTRVGASPHTVAAYRDAFRMLLKFAATALGRQPSSSVSRISMRHSWRRFLDHLESGRTNSVRTRNHRLAALRAFFRYVALAEPAFMLQAQRILAIPSKRYEKRPVEFLTEEESAALIAAPDPNTWIGRRDRALLLLAVQTGLRNSEITALKRKDVHTGTGAHVRCLGKGSETARAAVLRAR
ncbi:MAG: site-specific integrase [Bryobacterales bacterium]|nr:site-specific integrase [Bryobacterales bacterium]